MTAGLSTFVLLEIPGAVVEEYKPGIVAAARGDAAKIAVMDDTRFTPCTVRAVIQQKDEDELPALQLILVTRTDVYGLECLKRDIETREKRLDKLKQAANVLAIEYGHAEPYPAPERKTT